MINQCGTKSTMLKTRLKRKEGRLTRKVKSDKMQLPQ